MGRTPRHSRPTARHVATGPTGARRIRMSREAAGPLDAGAARSGLWWLADGTPLAGGMA